MTNNSNSNINDINMDNRNLNADSANSNSSPSDSIEKIVSDTVNDLSSSKEYSSLRFQDNIKTGGAILLLLGMGALALYSHKFREDAARIKQDKILAKQELVSAKYKSVRNFVDSISDNNIYFTTDDVLYSVDVNGPFGLIDNSIALSTYSNDSIVLYVEKGNDGISDTKREFYSLTVSGEEIINIHNLNSLQLGKVSNDFENLLFSIPDLYSRRDTSKDF